MDNFIIILAHKSITKLVLQSKYELTPVPMPLVALSVRLFYITVPLMALAELQGVIQYFLDRYVYVS